MDKMDEFLENFTKILLAKQKEHDGGDTYICKCGFKIPSGSVTAFEEHLADVQARALISYLWDK